MNSGFVHLHLHTEYSLLDGAIRIKELGNKLNALGMTSCAITDHGNMYGALEFYKEMIKHDIHPIIGSEVYVAPSSRFIKEREPGKPAYNHLVLLAKNNEGLKNLNRIVSIGFLEGFYIKPRVDFEILEKYSEGLICLSACMAGVVAGFITEGQYDEALKEAKKYDALFGRGNYYLEIQANSLPHQQEINASLIRISRETGIPLVATNDCHYLNSEDSYIEDILLCMQTGKTIDDEDRMRFQTNDFYIKSEDEMRDFFKNIPEAIDNTIKIAKECNVSYDLKTIHLPEYSVPETYSNNLQYITYLSQEGLSSRFKLRGQFSDTSIYHERLSYELETIDKMGYTDYFLIVWDYINYAKKQGIKVGPGRGSGAGSLVAYAIGITDIDPIRYDLIFERFLNVERVSMPDFDIDFCIERRQEVIDYVSLKYGEERVAQVISFGTLAAKMCVRDVTRVLNLPPNLGADIARLIDSKPGTTLSSSLENSSELKKLYDENLNVKKVIDISLKLEGMPRHTTTHAAGVIISGVPITDIVPLALNDDIRVVQFSKYGIESVGLLKFDFLGLRNLTVIDKTIKLIEERKGIKVSLDEISLDDKNVFDMIGRGDTLGIFQLESKGMTSFMRELKPSSIEDITAGISLYRPGPMDQIPMYIRCKHNPNEIKYAHPLLEPILNMTYGSIIYQEQVMRIVRDLAGFSMGQSDNIRRAMSKKDKKMMENYRDLFIHGGKDENGKEIRGAVSSGVPEIIAGQIFDDVSLFAGYAFNKSHACAYAFIGYYTAYLKYYFPCEYLTSILNSYISNIYESTNYIMNAPSMGVTILPPDINASDYFFKVEGDSIRIGLGIIKSVGEQQVNDLIIDRNINGKYCSFDDFIYRSSKLGIKKITIESLILSSALDFTGISRKGMRASVLASYDKLMQSMRNQIEGQLSLFDMGGDNKEDIGLFVPDLSEYSRQELLNYEKEMVGIYISGSPLDEYKEYINALSTFSCEDIAEKMTLGLIDEINDDKEVCMCAILEAKKLRTTKNKRTMAVLTLEDLYGTFEGALFGERLDKYAPMLLPNKPYVFVGKRKIFRDDTFSLNIDRIYEMPSSGDSLLKIQKEIRFILKDSPKESILRIDYNREYDANLMNRMGSLLKYFRGRKKMMLTYLDSYGKRITDEYYISEQPEVFEILKDILPR